MNSHFLESGSGCYQFSHLQSACEETCGFFSSSISDEFETFLGRLRKRRAAGSSNPSEKRKNLMGNRACLAGKCLLPERDHPEPRMAFLEADWQLRMPVTARYIFFRNPHTLLFTGVMRPVVSLLEDLVKKFDCIRVGEIIERFFLDCSGYARCRGFFSYGGSPGHKISSDNPALRSFYGDLFNPFYPVRAGEERSLVNPS